MLLDLVWAEQNVIPANVARGRHVEVKLLIGRRFQTRRPRIRGATKPHLGNRTTLTSRGNDHAPR